MKIASPPPLAAIVLFAAGCASSPFDSVPHPQPGEITVSSANYALTPAKAILASINNAAPINPKAIPLKPLAQPKYYLFSMGEFYKSDIPFADVARLLAPVLAAKGYIEASSAARSGRDPDKKIDLVLRIYSGERTWRDPIVRTTDLTWDDGIMGKESFSSLDTSGKSTVWDYRAGGDDAVLAQIELAVGNGTASTKPPPAASVAALRTGQYGNVGLNDPSNPMWGLSTDLTALPTRDFFMVVIQAFDIKEYELKHGKANMLWTTFVAIPKKEDETFSQMLPALARAAEPYFGETTQGMEVMDPANVEVGTPFVVPDKPSQPAVPAIP